MTEQHKRTTEDVDEGYGVSFFNATASAPLIIRTGGDDPVNHPSHYTSHPSGIECIQITEHMGFSIGNAIKYLWRSGLKDENAEIQDLEKAVWYINREIERRKKLKNG